MKRLSLILLACLASLPAWAQVPGTSLQINRTPITQGTTGLCLYDNAGKVGEQACGTGTAANIQVGTTTVGGGTSGRLLLDSAGTLGETVFALSGTSAQTYTFPSTSTTVAGLSVDQTFTGIETFSKTTGGGVLPDFFTGAQLKLGQADAENVAIFMSGFGNGTNLVGSRANGTYATPTVPILNSNFIQIAGRGWMSGAAGAAASYSGGAVSLTMAANETWSSTNRGTRILLSVTPNTTASRLDAIQISGDIAASASGLSVRMINGAQFWLSNAATTGLVAGALAALTNASMVIYDSTGTAYRFPVVTP